MYTYEERQHHDPVDLRPLEVIGDVSNAVLQYHSQGMDAMEECAVSSMPLSDEELQSLLQGTSQLHQALQAKLEVQLQKFEQYAWETCLHIPSGLMPAEAQAPQSDEIFDEPAEDQLDSELQSLREQIVQVQQQQHQISQEISALDQELAECDNASQLAAMASTSEPEKENLLHGASAIVSDALRLQPLLARAEALGRGKTWHSSTGPSQFQDAVLMAQKAIIKQEASVSSVPLKELKNLSEALQGLNTEQTGNKSE